MRKAKEDIIKERPPREEDKTETIEVDSDEEGGSTFRHQSSELAKDLMIKKRNERIAE